METAETTVESTKDAGAAVSMSPPPPCWPCPLLTRLDTVNGSPLEIVESIPGMIRAAAYECQKRHTANASVTGAGTASRARGVGGKDQP